MSHLHCEDEVEESVTVQIYFSDEQESPNEWGSFKLISFCRKHNSFEEPTDELFEAVENGKAYLLDCYQHGNTVWSLTGEGPQCRFDNAQGGGVLLVTGEFDSEEQQLEQARHFLKNYTQWCNGEVFGYTVLTRDEDLLDACSGYYDLDYMAQEIACNIGNNPNNIKNVTIEGEAGGWVDSILEGYLNSYQIEVK